MKTALLGMEAAEIGELLGVGQPGFRARQVYRAIYRQRVREIGEITTLPAALRSELAGRACVGWPEEARRYESADGTIRYLLRLADGKTVETVLMPEQARDTICISTQVGCPVDCKFCLTARLGLERNLTAGEIAGQLLVAAAGSGLDPAGGRINIVMMGQGEPLLNLSKVLKATRILIDAEGFGLSEKRITVSTAGIIPGMAEMGEAAVRPRLAVSLNASTEEQRRALMPVTRKYPLADLMAACRRYPLRPWERLTFEYVLLKGVNDTEADARRVARLVGQLRCKVNLIALNPGPGIPFETPEEESVLRFQRIVRRSVPCFVRKPRGREIFAACGQLRRVEIEAANRQIVNIP